MPSGATIADMTVCIAMAVAFAVGNLVMIVLIAYQRTKAKKFIGFLMYEQAEYHYDIINMAKASAKGETYQWPTVIERTQKVWDTTDEGPGTIHDFNGVLDVSQSELNTLTTYG